jgi:hypothetical protein
VTRPDHVPEPAGTTPAGSNPLTRMARRLRRRTRPAPVAHACWRALAEPGGAGVRLVLERTVDGAVEAVVVRDELGSGDPLAVAARLSALAREAHEHTRLEADRHAHWQSLRALGDDLDADGQYAPRGYWLGLDLPARYDAGAGEATVCRLGPAGIVQRVAHADLAAGTAIDAAARERDMLALAEMRARCAQLNRFAVWHGPQLAGPAAA